MPFQTGPEVILEGFNNKYNRGTNHITGNRQKQRPRLLLCTVLTPPQFVAGEGPLGEGVGHTGFRSGGKHSQDSGKQLPASQR